MMSDKPEQTGAQPQQKAAPQKRGHFRIAANVRAINAVSLVSGEQSFAAAFVEPNAGFEFSFVKPEAKATLAEAGTAIVVDCKFGLVMRAKGNTSTDGTSVGLVSATFRASYQLHPLKDGESPYESVELVAFAEINGLLTTVPYWREFASSCATRAGFQLSEVPVFNPLEEIKRRERESSNQTPRA